MSKRGITNYFEVIFSDADYDIEDPSADIETMVATLKADASTIHFDTAVGDVPMQKEPAYTEEFGEEDNGGNKEVIPKIAFIAVGLDEKVDNDKRDDCIALRGATKNAFMFDRNTGNVDKIKASKVNMNRTKTGNAKELWNFEAMSTKDGNQSSKNIDLVPIIP